MEDVWWVQVNGKARESSPAEIERLLADGSIDRNAYVWSEGTGKWVHYSESALARSRPPQPPPFGSGQAAPSMPEMHVADDGWQDIRPAPWRRYFARMIDVTVLGGLAWLVLGFVTAFASPKLYESIFTTTVTDNAIVSTVLTCLLVVPITTLLIGATGSSLGKWIFGIRVTRLDGKPIGFTSALHREGAVFVRGLGLGIPIVSLVTLTKAHNYLSKQGRTTWDENEPWVVTQRRQGAGQILLYVIGVSLWLATLVAIQAAKQIK